MINILSKLAKRSRSKIFPIKKQQLRYFRTSVIGFRSPNFDHKNTYGNKQLKEDLFDNETYKEEKKSHKKATINDILKCLQTQNTKVLWELYINGPTIKDVSLYQRIMHKFAMKGSIKKCFKLYNDLKKIPLQPTYEIFDTLLLACSKATGEGNFVERAIMVLDQMIKYSFLPNTKSFNLILLTCSNAVKSDLALKIFKFMLSNGIKPNAASLSLLVLSSKDNLKKAISFFEEYRKYVDIDSRVYSSLLTIIQDNDPPKAKFVYNDIIKSGFMPDKYTISILLRSLAMAKNFELCVTVLEKTLAEWMGQIDTDPFVFNVLLESATFASKDHLIKVLDLIETNKIEFHPRFYSVILPAFGKFGCEDIMEEYYKRALKDNAVTTKCLLGFIYLYNSQGDAEKAWKKFEELLKLGLKPDYYFKNALENTINEFGSDQLKKKFKEHDALKVLDTKEDVFERIPETSS